MSHYDANISAPLIMRLDDVCTFILRYIKCLYVDRIAVAIAAMIYPNFYLFVTVMN